MEKLAKRLNFWLRRLPSTGGLPSENAELQLRKAVLILLAGIYTILGAIWGLAYLALGRPLAGSFPLLYSAVSALSLIYFLRSKRFKLFCRCQLAMILILPFALQWRLGGFAASGAVAIWAILAPIGALMFAGTARAVPWFLAYAVLMAIFGIPGLNAAAQNTLPAPVVVISFVLNIGGVSAIVFFLLKYFVQGRERAMDALEKEHQRVRHSLSLAMEVQQNLLPRSAPEVAGTVNRACPLRDARPTRPAGRRRG